MSGFSVVVASDRGGGIGKDGDLPWRLKGDMAYFKALTSAAGNGQRNAVVMGRKTWESIPERFRPLRKRLNVVISRQTDYALPAGVVLTHSFADALEAARQADVDRVFVIGGGAVYAEALQHPDCERVYLTRIAERFDCDTFLPPLEAFDLEAVTQESEDGGVHFDFATYTRK